MQPDTKSIKQFMDIVGRFVLLALFFAMGKAAGTSYNVSQFEMQGSDVTATIGYINGAIQQIQFERDGQLILIQKQGDVFHQWTQDGWVDVEVSASDYLIVVINANDSIILTKEQ